MGVSLIKIGAKSLFWYSLSLQLVEGVVTFPKSIAPSLNHVLTLQRLEGSGVSVITRTMLFLASFARKDPT